MAANSDTTAWFIIGRVLPAYLGVLAPGCLSVFIPAAMLCDDAFGYWLVNL